MFIKPPYGYGETYNDPFEGYEQVGKLVPNSYKDVTIDCFQSWDGMAENNPLVISPFPPSEANKKGFVRRTDTGATIAVYTSDLMNNGKYCALKAEGTFSQDDVFIFLSADDVGKTITVEIYLQ